MTLIERWGHVDRDVETFRVNGCMTAEIHGYEMRSVEEWFGLIRERVMPLLWMAMPVHDAEMNQERQ